MSEPYPIQEEVAAIRNIFLHPLFLQHMNYFQSRISATKLTCRVLRPEGLFSILQVSFFFAFQSTINASP